MTARRERSQRVLPFALASAAAVPLAYLPPEVPRLPYLLAAAILMLVVALAVALPDWSELPLGMRTVPAVAYLVGVALLRHADGGTASGYSPLVLVPLFWVALYGTRGDLWATIVAIAAIFVVPAVMVGPPLYDVSEFKRAAIWLVVASIVGVTVQRLTLQVRTANRELEAAAWTDVLTGVGNRRAWNALVNRELAAADRRGTTLAVGLLDMDRFKRFNDEHGHQAGDQLLRRTAQRWSQLLRPNDLIVRWGGEEFAVLLPDTSGDEATMVVERLRGAVPDGQTVSAGLTLRHPGEPADEAIRRADTLLYAAKQAGRDRTIADVLPDHG